MSKDRKEAGTGKSATGATAGGFGSALQRRLIFGTNVAIMCLAAVMIVFFANWISFKKHWRKDLATFGVYQPSDRTKRIVDQIKGKVRLTSIYTSTEEETSREKYFPAVRDYFYELALYAPDKIEVQHITRDSEKLALIARVQAKYGKQAKAYRKAISDFKNFAKDAQEPLTQAFAAISGVTASGGYLAQFPQVADLQSQLEKSLKTLSETSDELDRLVVRSGLPRFEDAKQKIYQALDQVKQTITSGGKVLRNIAELADAAGPNGEEFFKTLPDRMKQMQNLFADLQKTVGTPQKELPTDLKAALREFSRQAYKVSIWLEDEIRRQDSLANKHQIITTTAQWRISRPILGNIVQVMSLTDVLESTSRELVNLRQQIRQLLRLDVPQDQLATAIRKLRALAARMSQNANAIAQRLLQLRESLQSPDEASRAVLQQAKEHKWLADVVTKIDSLRKQVDDLPELKLGEIADKLEEPNVIVVETDDDVRVISFDDVWPQSQVLREFGESGSPKRVFNGDQAIASALLSISQPPVATVIITYFQSEVPASMRPFMPRDQSSIPRDALSKLRELLEKANLAVKEWNLAKEESPPEPEKGTKPVYLLLPPPPNTPMPGPRQEQFGDVHLERVKKVLSNGGRGIFLCRWEPPRRRMIFMPAAEPKYEYEKYLRQDWGVDVLYKYRVVYGVPDTRKPGYYGVNLERWAYMLLNNFTDHPIGKPLRARRVLMIDVCPVEPDPKVPKDVKIEPILVVPARDEYWADSDVLDLVRRVTEETGGLITKDPTDKPSPFPVAVAAINTKTKSEIVVLGNGASLLDDYLGSRVPRIGERGERIMFDPPPTANADLVINSVLWLADKADLIGAGPVIIPPVQPIPDKQMAAIRLLVWVLLPGLTLASGLVVMMIRRR